MSDEDPIDAAAALERAAERARDAGLRYAGDVTPAEAWAAASVGAARIVDVRSPEELAFVGRVPGSTHVPWARGLKLERNPHFVAELEAVAGKDEPVLLLCRSARRSVLAAVAATEVGFARAFNIAEGFEGEIDGARQRGRIDGWRRRGLPWQQD